MRCLILLMCWAGLLEWAWANPAQIVLLRHAEKPVAKADPHLSDRGRARAEALALFLSTNNLCARKGPPAALIAPKFTPHGHSRRPYETLEPLAERLKLPIQADYRAEEYAALARQILADPALEGKTVVICWVHDYLPELAARLGVKPQPRPWKDSVYDRVWVITYRKHHTTLTVLPQRLLPGDSGQ